MTPIETHEIIPDNYQQDLIAPILSRLSGEVRSDEGLGGFLSLLNQEELEFNLSEADSEQLAQIIARLEAIKSDTSSPMHTLRDTFWDILETSENLRRRVTESIFLPIIGDDEDPDQNVLRSFGGELPSSTEETTTTVDSETEVQQPDASQRFSESGWTRDEDRNMVRSSEVETEVEDSEAEGVDTDTETAPVIISGSLEEQITNTQEALETFSNFLGIIAEGHEHEGLIGIEENQGMRKYIATTLLRLENDNITRYLNDESFELRMNSDIETIQNFARFLVDSSSGFDPSNIEGENRWNQVTEEAESQLAQEEFWLSLDTYFGNSSTDLLGLRPGLLLSMNPDLLDARDTIYELQDRSPEEVRAIFNNTMDEFRVQYTPWDLDILPTTFDQETIDASFGVIIDGYGLTESEAYTQLQENTDYQGLEPEQIKTLLVSRLLINTQETFTGMLSSIEEAFNSHETRVTIGDEDGEHIDITFESIEQKQKILTTYILLIEAILDDPDSALGIVTAWIGNVLHGLGSIRTTIFGSIAGLGNGVWEPLDLLGAFLSVAGTVTTYSIARRAGIAVRSPREDGNWRSPLAFRPELTSIERSSQLIIEIEKYFFPTGRSNVLNIDEILGRHLGIQHTSRPDNYDSLSEEDKIRVNQEIEISGIFRDRMNALEYRLATHPDLRIPDNFSALEPHLQTDINTRRLNFIRGFTREAGDIAGLRLETQIMQYRINLSWIARMRQRGINLTRFSGSRTLFSENGAEFYQRLELLTELSHLQRGATRVNRFFPTDIDGFRNYGEGTTARLRERYNQDYVDMNIEPQRVRARLRSMISGGFITEDFINTILRNSNNVQVSETIDNLENISNKIGSSSGVEYFHSRIRYFLTELQSSSMPFTGTGVRTIYAGISQLDGELTGIHGIYSAGSLGEDIDTRLSSILPEDIRANLGPKIRSIINHDIGTFDDGGEHIQQIYDKIHLINSQNSVGNRTNPPSSHETNRRTQDLVTLVDTIYNSNGGRYHTTPVGIEATRTFTGRELLAGNTDFENGRNYMIENLGIEPDEYFREILNGNFSDLSEVTSAIEQKLIADNHMVVSADGSLDWNISGLEPTNSRVREILNRFTSLLQRWRRPSTETVTATAETETLERPETDYGRTITPEVDTSPGSPAIRETISADTSIDMTNSDHMTMVERLFEYRSLIALGNGNTEELSRIQGIVDSGALGTFGELSSQLGHTDINVPTGELTRLRQARRLDIGNTLLHIYRVELDRQGINYSEDTRYLAMRGSEHNTENGLTELRSHMVGRFNDISEFITPSRGQQLVMVGGGSFSTYFDSIRDYSFQHGELPRGFDLDIPQRISLGNAILESVRRLRR